MLARDVQDLLALLRRQAPPDVPGGEHDTNGSETWSKAGHGPILAQALFAVPVVVALAIAVPVAFVVPVAIPVVALVRLRLLLPGR